jgi:hypothetical protein
MFLMGSAFELIPELQYVRLLESLMPIGLLVDAVFPHPQPMQHLNPPVPAEAQVSLILTGTSEVSEFDLDACTEAC